MNALIHLPSVGGQAQHLNGHAATPAPTNVDLAGTCGIPPANNARNPFTTTPVGAVFTQSYANSHYGYRNTGYFDQDQNSQQGQHGQQGPGQHLASVAMGFQPQNVNNGQPFVMPPPMSHMTSGTGAGATGTQATNHGFELSPIPELGRITLRGAGLSFNEPMTPEELFRRKKLVIAEINRIVAQPPILPASTLQEMEAKEPLEEFWDFPKDGEVHPQLILDIKKKNVVIAGKHQVIDRARNNDAAKRSRAKRAESLTNAKVMLYSQASELAWQRLKMISMGANPFEWDLVSNSTRRKIHSTIVSAVNKMDKERIVQKRTAESAMRAEHQRARAQLKRQFSAKRRADAEELYKKYNATPPHADDEDDE